MDDDDVDSLMMNSLMLRTPWCKLHDDDMNEVNSLIIWVRSLSQYLEEVLIANDLCWYQYKIFKAKMEILDTLFPTLKSLTWWRSCWSLVFLINTYHMPLSQVMDVLLVEISVWCYYLWSKIHCQNTRFHGYFDTGLVRSVMSKRNTFSVIFLDFIGLGAPLTLNAWLIMKPVGCWSSSVSYLSTRW